MERLLNAFKNIIPPLLLIFLLIGCAKPATDQLASQAEALLNETAVDYKLNGCYDGMVGREMYCDLTIKQDQLNNFIFRLRLNNEIPDFEGEDRFVLVHDYQKPTATYFMKKYRRSFEVPQWVPAKHGFSSVILFYNKKTEKGCLYLSIAPDQTASE